MKMIALMKHIETNKLDGLASDAVDLKEFNEDLWSKDKCRKPWKIVFKSSIWMKDY